MKDRDKYAHVIPLEGVSNFRDLGGYPAENGLFGQKYFFSLPALFGLTENDIQKMSGLQIRTIIDLRSESEIASDPDPLSSHPDFTYQNIQLIDQVFMRDSAIYIPDSMFDLYKNIIDAKTGIKSVFNALCEAKSGVVFHCTAGKDRTGVIAALLLLISGVSEQDVVWDYAITDSLMSEEFELQMANYRKKFNVDVPDYFFKSMPVSMEKTIDHIKNTYGTVENYCDFCGISQEQIKILKNKFLTGHCL